MNKEEIKKMVLEIADEHFKTAPVKDTITYEKILQEAKENLDIVKKFAEEIKQINKKIDLRDPLIEIKSLKNENETTVLNENTKKRWSKVYNYEIPKDEDRS